MIFLNIGLWFLLFYFTWSLITGLVRMGGWLKSKDDGEKLAGCLGLVFYPVFFGLSIATMIGALFTVN